MVRDGSLPGCEWTSKGVQFHRDQEKSKSEENPIKGYMRRPKQITSGEILYIVNKEYGQYMGVDLTKGKRAQFPTAQTYYNQINSFHFNNISS